jgi:hypothetical protein
VRKRDFFEKSRGRQHHDLASRYINALRGIDDPEAWVNCAKRAINLLDLAMCDVRDAGERGNVISAGVERDYRRLKSDLAKLTPPPAPHGGGTSQDASGGQSSP